MHVIEFSNPSIGNVRMAVDESGRCRSTSQIDALGRGAGQAQNVAIRAHGDNFSIANRERLNDAVAGIDGEDPAIEQHQLRLFGAEHGRCHSAERKAGKQRKHPAQAEGSIDSGGH
jgi:hypothetical protein